MKLIGLVNSCRLYPVYEHVWSNSKQNVEVSETWGVRLRVLVIKIHIVSNLNLYGKSPRRHQHKGNENIQTGVRHACLLSSCKVRYPQNKNIFKKSLKVKV